MKTLMLLCLLGGEIVAAGQVRYGNFLGRAIREDAPEKPKPPPPSVYRFVTNQLFDVTKSRLWEQHDMIVQTVLTNALVGYLITERGAEAEVMLLNVGAVATGSQLKLTAMARGMTNWQDKTLLLLDCGVTPEYHARQKAASKAASAPATNQPAAKK